MQGNSESWRRLDRMRAAGAGPPPVVAPVSPIAVDEPCRPTIPSAVSDAGDDGSGLGEPTSAGPVPLATRHGRHAARSADDVVAPAIAGAGPGPGSVRAWVPDDDIEGPVAGAALDRWIARQAATARSDDQDPLGADGGAVLDGTGPASVSDDSSRESRGTADGVAIEEAGPDGVSPRPGDSERPGRPVSRWRAGLRRSLGRRAELWVPESLRGARVDPGRRGAMALLLVAALAAAITAVGVWRDRPEARPVATVSAGSVELVSADPPRSSGVAAPGSMVDDIDLADPGPTTPAQIVVSVTGLVVTPGAVTVPGDARVADAIAAAGGLTDGADVTGLNLAAKLTDGASVVVGAGGASVQGADVAGATGTSSAGGARLVDLNTADADELDSLPGVGPVMAGNIVAWREANGRFTSVDQLQEISGVGPARYAQLSELVSVS